MYIFPTQARTVTYYMRDPSSRQGDRPATSKTAVVLTATQMWSWVLEGLNAKTDWLTDWLTDLMTDRQLQSNSDSDLCLFSTS